MSVATEGERLRVLYFVTHAMTARILLRGQLSFLREQGFAVAVAASGGVDLERTVRNEGVEAFALPFTRRITPLRDLVALVRAAAAIRAFAPHVVNASTPKAALIGGLAAALCRVPVRYDMVRGLPLETATGLRRVLLRAAERCAAATAHRVICVGPSLAARVLAERLCRPEKVRVLGAGTSNGVDLERFRPADEGSLAEVEDLRRELGVPDGAALVGFVGRLTRDKGLEDLARAFGEASSRARGGARLLLVGAFEDEDPVPPAVRRRLESSPEVILTGAVEDTAPLYRAMDLLAFPSRREGMPNVPLEAAACGLPVVGYRVTGTIDAVVDGETGALVEVGDWRGLAAAMDSYLADPGLRRVHGEAGRTRVARLYSRESVWRAWAEEYRDAWRSRTL